MRTFSANFETRSLLKVDENVQMGLKSKEQTLSCPSARKGVTLKTLNIS